MFCEKSGNCELQAVAYKLGILGERYPFLWPDRKVDMSHKDIMVDHNRCILCGRCVVASADHDGKGVFEFVGRGHERRIQVNSEGDLADTNVALTDKAMDVCPVGCIVKKRVGFKVPVGQRTYDKKPIGSDVEGV
jgi:[NiFe] hydrogenase diaphorase moiety small subunit